VYYDRLKRSLYSSSGVFAFEWIKSKVANSAGPMSLSINERTDETFLTWLNRPRAAAFSAELL
jgi:hypothetical protein